MDLEKLLSWAKYVGACPESMKEVQKYNSLEEASKDPEAPAWAAWLLEHLVQTVVDDQLFRRIQQLAMDVYWHQWRLIVFGDLDESDRQTVLRDICSSPLDSCDALIFVPSSRWSESERRALLGSLATCWHKTYALLVNYGYELLRPEERRQLELGFLSGGTQGERNLGEGIRLLTLLSWADEGEQPDYPLHPDTQKELDRLEGVSNA